MPSVMYFEQQMYSSAGGRIISMENAICRFHAVWLPPPASWKLVSAPTVSGLYSSELMKINGMKSSFHQKLADMMPTVM